MTRLAFRRRCNIAVFLLCAVGVVAVDVALSVSMYPTAFPSGWTLLGLILLLTSYNARKT